MKNLILILVAVLTLASCGAPTTEVPATDTCVAQCDSGSAKVDTSAIKDTTATAVADSAK